MPSLASGDVSVRGRLKTKRKIQMGGFPGLVFSDLEGRLMVHHQPVEQRPPLDMETLSGLLKQAGFGDWFLLPDALTTLVARVNTLQGEFDMSVGERRDGSLKLDVEAGGMTAWLTVLPAQGGKAVTLDEAMAALGQVGVVFGIDEPALRLACEGASGQPVAVAMGVVAQQGEDARFEMLIDVSRDRAPKMNEQGLVDFRELGAIPVVEAGQALMRRIPATPGVDGTSVRGVLIKAKAGKEMAFAEKLEGTCLSPHDADLLWAADKGQPVSVPRGVMVEQVASFKSVDMASGNVDFDGSVTIEGDVMTGMKVRATGDIIVAGMVDGGDLEAKGNIQVGGGVIAQARVHAGGSVSARFVENSQVFAGTAIAIDDMALQSDLQALNQIVVGHKSPQRGRLVGGSARAMMLVRTPVLGAAASSVTTVQVGVNPELEARHQDLLVLMDKQKEEEEHLKKLVQHLTQKGDPKGILERAKASWKQVVQQWAKSLLEKEELEKQLGMIAGAKVEVTDGVSGTVDMVFGHKTRHLMRNFDAGVFSIVEDRLVFTGSDGKPTALG